MHQLLFCQFTATVGIRGTIHTLLWLLNDHFCFKECEERVLKARVIMPVDIKGRHL